MVTGRFWDRNMDLRVAAIVVDTAPLGAFIFLSVIFMSPLSSGLAGDDSTDIPDARPPRVV
jgi:hypothetical protein